MEAITHPSSANGSHSESETYLLALADRTLKTASLKRDPKKKKKNALRRADRKLGMRSARRISVLQSGFMFRSAARGNGDDYFGRELPFPTDDV